MTDDLPGLDLRQFDTWFERSCPGEISGPLQGRLERDRSNVMSEPRTVISSATSSGASTMPSLSTKALAE